MGSGFVVLWIFFCGFVVPRDTIPPYFIWIHYISPLKVSECVCVCVCVCVYVCTFQMKENGRRGDRKRNKFVCVCVLLTLFHKQPTNPHQKYSIEALLINEYVGKRFSSQRNPAVTVPGTLISLPLVNVCFQFTLHFFFFSLSCQNFR